ncbi:hypothetical protein JR316_0002401 [Psilocybe cubensis]|uniref:Uncharacterized protein n=1 Tax=Psilocybe cubensis TaxID=181762 RepID=A0ACB8HBW5_PSICU|nr:hypothetical protein JR316_0002401 [Psilocybe cubensis]KAH9485493.1 hypothetical protein JR316_0002401 [Psilocybe cubensis]
MAYHQPVTLPPEIWNQILSEIPRTQVSDFLGTCSLFHDIIVKFLFASIKVYFIGSETGLEMLNTSHVDWTEEIAMKLMITLANALLFTPNLHTFRWIGNGPALDNLVGECLPDNLKKLVVQSSLPLESIQHLRNVTSLHLPMPFFFPDDEEAHDRLVYDYSIQEYTQLFLGDILHFVSPNLQSLRITAIQVRDVPIRIFNTLIDLEILSTLGNQEELVGLDIVFHHASNLQSLTLVGLFVPEIFSFLPPHSLASLPLLTSFRFSWEDLSLVLDTVGESEFQALCRFLHGRSLIRRLYLRLPMMRWMQTSRLLSVIRDLPGIEVLGLHTGRDILVDADIIETLARSLPMKLHALHIAINWGGGNLLPLVDAIGKLPHLTFLHLYGVVVRLPILLEDLAHEAPGLKMIGLNRALWDIVRVGSEIIKNKYPRWRIKFCVEEDFLCADDAWLFKYN